MFANEASLLRLVTIVLMEISEESETTAPLSLLRVCQDEPDYVGLCVGSHVGSSNRDIRFM